MAVQIARRQRKRKTAVRLPRKVRGALTDFQRRLLELFPADISQLILFGSYARGEAAPDSDVDVLVVVKWNEERLPDGRWVSWVGDPRWQSIINAATDTMLIYGIDIAPVVVGSKLFQEGFPLINRVRREGKRLWANQN